MLIFVKLIALALRIVLEEEIVKRFQAFQLVNAMLDGQDLTVVSLFVLEFPNALEREFAMHNMIPLCVIVTLDGVPLTVQQVCNNSN